MKSLCAVIASVSLKPLMACVVNVRIIRSRNKMKLTREGEWVVFTIVVTVLIGVLFIYKLLEG